MPAPLKYADTTTDEIRRLPALARLPWVERIRIFYPQWHAVTDKVHACHQRQAHAAEPPCLLLVGATGVGKTTLLTAYTARYPRQRQPHGLHLPVLRATIIPPATVKSLASTLLHAIGDPAAEHGTTVTLTQRLMHYLRACGVELLILDELQHFLDRDSYRVLETVSNWLKTVIKETHIACVLAGLVNEAEQVVDTNPQLARLFGDPVVLQPFTWDEAYPSTIADFQAVLAQIEHLLPLQDASHLAAPDLAQRCFVASGGVLSYLMALIRYATTLALAADMEYLDQHIFARAYDERLGGQRRGVPNPFLGPLPAVTSPAVAQRGAPLQATSRRGRRRTRG